MDVRELGRILDSATGQKWTIELSDGASSPSLYDQLQMAGQVRREEILATPIMAAALAAFPAAALVEPGRE
jgi:DNA polymerase-3 subunit gamma/tau